MFNGLNVKTSYSLLRSIINIPNLVKKAKEIGYTSLGVCDYDVLSAFFNFQEECIKNDIKPIFSLEINIKYSGEIYPLSLIALDNEGYKNLIKISSIINISEEKCLDILNLKNYIIGLCPVFLSDNMPGSYHINNKDEEKYLNILKDLKNFFDEYYVGLSQPYAKLSQNNYPFIRKCLNILSLKTIVYNKITYIDEEDFDAFNVLKYLRERKNINDEIVLEEKFQHLLTKEEILELYDEQDIENTNYLVFKVKTNLKIEKTSLPIFLNDKSLNPKEYLISLCKKGLKVRLKNSVTKEYLDRLKYELKVIINMNFENYFLIVYDIVRYGKRNNIVIGPGRGSAAGSLVSYCLGITEIDPIKYNLLFERFLNPQRVSMPDIDIDIQDNKRSDIYSYIINKYGDERVCHILTYNSLGPRQVIRDVAKILDFNQFEIDNIAKMIPNIERKSLKHIYDEYRNFKILINSSEKNRRLFKLCLKLEGLPRHYSIHAAGIVVSNKKLNNIVPTIKVNGLDLATQYTMNYLEKLGLIKIDLLGLRNLAIIQEVVSDILKINEDFKLYDIKLDDQKTFDLICSGLSLGIFQIETVSMRKLIMEIEPRNFEDISISLALYRPGTKNNIEEYLRNRKDQKNIIYLHDDLKEILSFTHGIIIYQEQIMQIAQKMAGFSLSKADILRKAISKKHKDEMILLKDEFINGMIVKGYDFDLSNNIYELILKFADYGFNRSHSIAYGLIVYQMAYLKANFPLYFYKSILNSAFGDQNKIYSYILEAKAQKINIDDLDINKSEVYCSVYDNSLILGLGMIKNLNLDTVKKIVEERNKRIFKDYIDAIKRLCKILKNEELQILINAGCFDSFGFNRKTMIENLKKIFEYYEKAGDVISMYEPDITLYKENSKDVAQKEKDALGFYYKTTPILNFKKKLNINTENLSLIQRKFGYVKVFGMIEKIKKHQTKRQEMMAFVEIIDETSTISLVIMPSLFNINDSKMKKGCYCFAQGYIEKEGSILVKKMEVFDGENFDS